MMTGSLVAMITPMEPHSLAVDWAALEKLINWHVEQGSDGIVAVGTTGESATLDMDEHIEVIRFCVKVAEGRIPIVAGTGGNSTSEALELTDRAREAGADACLLVVPYYNKPTQEGLYLHFKLLAEQVDIPQILYNVPGRTACDLLPETVIRLSALDNIIGIKEASADIDRVPRLVEACPADFAVYSGDDITALELMLAGGKGNISVTANVAPADMHRLCKAAVGGDETLARELNEKLRPLNTNLFLESNPIPVKWAAAEMGLCQHGAIRLPLTDLSPHYHDAVRQAMTDAGIEFSGSRETPTR